jgi:hypothetical protein
MGTPFACPQPSPDCPFPVSSQAFGMQLLLVTALDQRCGQPPASDGIAHGAHGESTKHLALLYDTFSKS